MMYLKVLALVCLAGGVWADPVVLWASEPVRPGEAVQLFGKGFRPESVVKIGRSEIKPIAVEDDLLTFVLPKKFNGGELSVDGVPFELNRPKVWWRQGDRGEEVSAGGWVRFFGKSLQDLTVKNLGLSGWTVVSQDCWQVTVQVPKKTAPGLYNGIKVVEAVPYWKTNVFDVTRFGAIPNDRLDDTDAVLAALEAVRKNEGGILYFPAGRYGVSTELALPPKTLLRGESAELSMIYRLDEDNPQGAIVSLSDDCGVEDIFIGSGNFKDGIVTSEEGNKNICVRRVRMRLLHTDVSQEEGIRRLTEPHYGYTRIFFLAGKNLEMSGCDFVGTKGIGRFHADYGIVKNNVLRSPDCLYYKGRRLIFEGNDHRGQAVSYGNGSREGYFAGNLMGDCYGPPYGQSDRETFTFDHGRPCYYDYAKTEGTTVLLSGGKDLREGYLGGFRGFGPQGKSGQDWIGQTVYIVSGSGAGQWRNIVAVPENDQVVIDRPWTILPDEKSIYTISYSRYHVILANNTVFDGNPFQAYGNGVEVIFSGNKCYRNSGLNARAFFGYHPGVNWFVQFLDNEIMDGNSLRGPASQWIPAQDGGIGFLVYPTRGPLTYSLAKNGVFRRNILHGNACLYVRGDGRMDGLLVNRNTILKTGVGIDLRAPNVRGAVVLDNSFTDVKTPYRLQGGVLVDVADPTKYKLGDLLDLEPPEWKFHSIGMGWTPNCRFTHEFVYPSYLPPAVLTMTTQAPKGWTIALVEPVQLVPGKTAKAGFVLVRPDKFETTFSFDAHWSIRGKDLNLTDIVPYGCLTFRMRDWLAAGGLPCDGNVLTITNLLGCAEDKLMRYSSEKLKAYDWPNVKCPKGTAMYARAEVKAARPLRVRVEFERIPYKSVLFLNGKQVGASGRVDGERVVQLKEGTNRFEILKFSTKEDCQPRLMLHVVGPTQPGDLTK